MLGSATAIDSGRVSGQDRAPVLRVRPITAAEHAEWLRQRPSVSFLQVPAWAGVKPDWDSENVAWTTPDGEVAGAGLVLHRRIRLLGRSLAYLPEGPVIDWGSPDLSAWLAPLVAHLRSRGAFAVRMGPPVTRRWWSTATVHSAVGAGHPRFLYDLPPDGLGQHGGSVAAQLHALGWAPAPGIVDVSEHGDEDAEAAAGEPAAGFTAGQPQYVFQVPLAGRSLQDVYAGFNPQWRRNLRVAERYDVRVDVGDVHDLDVFHRLYRVTAARGGFTPRPAEYFRRMWHALGGTDGRAETGNVRGSSTGLTLYLGRHGGDVQAAAIAVRVGDHVWYTYGASADENRHVRASNAVQWRMLRDAHASGAAVYDLRGIGASLDRDDPLVGLTRFKLGSGGRAVEYVGEWDLALNRPLYRAVTGYLRRR
jgi:lipid II:glycine glycyltransferase (peptidoglycan interpeptide bridge formation enzyme)